MYDTNTGLVSLGIRIRQYITPSVQSFTPSRTDQLLFERLRQGFCLIYILYMFNIAVKFSLSRLCNRTYVHCLVPRFRNFVDFRFFLLSLERNTKLNVRLQAEEHGWSIKLCALVTLVNHVNGMIHLEEPNIRGGGKHFTSS